MAEILGAVAAGIGIASFVIQIGDSVAKLKGFIGLMKEAPTELRSLIERVENLNKLLDFIAAQTRQMQIPDVQSTIVDNIFQDYYKTALRLATIARDLEKEVAAHITKGRVKFAMKKQALDSLKTRLEEEKTTVLLSYQFCLGFAQQNLLRSQLGQMQLSQQLLHDMREIRTKVAEIPSQTVSTTVCSAELSSCNDILPTPKETHLLKDDSNTGRWECPSAFEYIFGSIYYRSTKRPSIPSNSSRQDDISVRICTPAWLFRKVYEARATRHRWNWRFNFRVHYIVPENTPLFEYARNGDIKGMQGLFDSRQATPFDRGAKYGTTALHVAAEFGHVSACRFLLEQGADSFAPTQFKDTPLVNAASYALGKRYNHPKIMDLFQLFIVDYQQDSLLDFGDRGIFWDRVLGDHPEAMALILKQVYPPYYERPLETRVTFAMGLLSADYSAPHPASVKLAISAGAIEASCFDIVGEYNYYYESTLFGTIIEGIAECVAHNRHKDLMQWVSLLAEAVRSQVDLHYINRWKNDTTTSLLFFIDTFPGRYVNCSGRGQARNAGLKKYLKALEAAGVDLFLYGEGEKQLYDGGRIDARCFICGSEFVKHLEDFKFGASIDDWHIWDYCPFNYECVEEFWHMIESPWERMPGAWVE